MSGCSSRPSARVVRASSALLVSVALLVAAAPVALAPPPQMTADAQRRALEALVRAYPQALNRIENDTLIWRKGPPTPVNIGGPRRSAAQVIANPGVADIFAWPYPFEPADHARGDPGRPRPEAIFARLYGDCRKGAVDPQLARVRWVNGTTVRMTRAQGASAALAAVARDIEAAGLSGERALQSLGGTYNCRTVAGTETLSMHAYGAAIDLSPRHGGYWRWGKRPPRAMEVSPAIIAIFERHGFIWGGKWAHFDSFHFEYRPEFQELATQTSIAR